MESLELEMDWVEHWAKVFCFDVLIGNTDRHQDNWGLIRNKDGKGRWSFAPAFDNNSSLGREMSEIQFERIISADIDKYVTGKKATHHLTLNRNDGKRLKHIDFIKLLISQYPKMVNYMQSCLGFSVQDLTTEVNDLVYLSNSLGAQYVQLTPKRADLIIRLVNYRKEKLWELISNASTSPDY